MKKIQISFKNLTEKQTDYMFKAEGMLAKAGFIFDTGYDLRKNIRDWFLESDENITFKK